MKRETARKIVLITSLCFFVFGLITAIMVYQDIPKQEAIQEEFIFPLPPEAQVCDSYEQVRLSWIGFPIQDWFNKDYFYAPTKITLRNGVNKIGSIDALMTNSENFSSVFVLVDNAERITYFAQTQPDEEISWISLEIPQNAQNKYYYGVIDYQIRYNKTCGRFLLTYRLSPFYYYMCTPFSKDFTENLLLMLVPPFLLISGILGCLVYYFSGRNAEEKRNDCDF